MKINTLFAFVLLVFLTIGCQATTEPYGEDISLKETTSIADILAAPESYVGKTVQIEGRILDVCPMKGCWIEIESEDGQKMLKVKVDDGDIVFKQESKGKHAIAEGEVYTIDMDRDEAISYLQHLADEKGEAFDSTSVKGPMVIYQIKGTGARIEM